MKIMINTLPDQSKKPSTADKDDKLKSLRLWSLALELGYTIALPLVAAALVGRLLDRHLGTAPWLLLAGILISIAVSTWLIYKKIKGLI
jgi:F0F1-type ATP synthase assembly protein I